MVQIGVFDATAGDRQLEGYGGLTFRFGPSSGGPPQPSVSGVPNIVAVVSGMHLDAEASSLEKGVGELIVTEDALIGFVSSGQLNGQRFDEFDTTQVAIFHVSLDEVAAVAVTRRNKRSGPVGTTLLMELATSDGQGTASLQIEPMRRFTPDGLTKVGDAMPIAEAVLQAAADRQGRNDVRWTDTGNGLMCVLADGEDETNADGSVRRDAIPEQPPPPSPTPTDPTGPPWSATSTPTSVAAGGQVDPRTGLPHADYGIRVVAHIIDTLVVFAMFFVGGLGVLLAGGVFGLVSEGLGSLVTLVGAMVVFGLTIAYLIVSEAGPLGQTLGKHLMGVRVVGPTMSPLGYGTSTIRYLGRILDSIVCGIPLGLLWPLFDNQNRTWHDMVANTRVVAVPATEKSFTHWVRNVRG